MSILYHKDIRVVQQYGKCYFLLHIIEAVNPLNNGVTSLQLDSIVLCQS